MKLTEEDKAQVAAILRTHAELQDQAALRGTTVLARLQLDEPTNPLTEAMAVGVTEIEADCANLIRLAVIFETDGDIR